MSGDSCLGWSLSFLFFGEGGGSFSFYPLFTLFYGGLMQSVNRTASSCRDEAPMILGLYRRRV